MPHAVSTPPEPMPLPNGAILHCVPAAQDNLIWLLEYSPGLVLAVDGPSAGPVLQYCEQHQLTWTTILNTHTHHDHIGINRDALRRGLTLSVYGCPQRDAIPGLTQPVTEGHQVRFGDLQAEVWLTEGHIDGHICYIFDGLLFCGDTMFAGGCGYLFDGPPEKMAHSLDRLATLPDNTLVCCAHEYTEDNLRFALSVEPHNQVLQARFASVIETRGHGRCTLPSTIGEERATNPFLRSHQPELLSNLRAQGVQLTSTTRSAVFAATRAHKDSKRYKQV